MMKKLHLSVRILAITLPLLVSLAAKAQDCSAITRQQLRSMLVELGYEVKDLETEPGKEKFSVMTRSNSLDIPVGIEQSPSSKYIWLTVNLGTAPADTSSKYKALIRENAKTQPCLFYSTASGLLMMGLPLDNRGISNTILRDRIDAVSRNVGNTKQIWGDY